MPYSRDLYQERIPFRYTAADWRESVGDDQPGGGDSHSLEQPSEASLQVQVPWQKARSFIRFVLGWSYADDPRVVVAAKLSMRRELPQSHPRYGWLRASSVTWNGLAPDAVAGIGSKVDGAYSDSLPVGAYQLLMATVRFTDHPWLYLSDDQVSRGLFSLFSENNRYTYFDPAPSVQIISAEGLNNVAFGNGPQRNKAVPAPFGTLMAVTTKTYNWMQVPHEFISAGSGPLNVSSNNFEFNPTKIDLCVGRVNSTDFLGNPAGTLLLQAPQYERFRFPVQTAQGVFGYFGWNIKFPMQYFDPDRGGDEASLIIRGGDTSGTVTIANSPAFPVGAPTTSGVYYANDVLNVSWLDGGGVTRTRTGMTVVGTPTVAGAVTTVAITGGTGTVLPAALTLLNIVTDRFRGHQLVPSRFDLKWYAALRQDGQSKLYPEANYNSMFTHVLS